ncbi:MASE3 domain-containing protein, partial [Malonomonas rubra]|uniref:MASE3 domain-containing protein n=1 Tax=Malonomonas rubra TaxID=57040 RepID=UPI0026EE608C
MLSGISTEKQINRVLLFGAPIGLYFTSKIHYLPFHNLAEIFSIIVASTIFVIAIYSPDYQRNRYLLFISIGYLFIGFLDRLHTLSHKGMNIFTAYNYYANQLWIATRYLGSLTL